MWLQFTDKFTWTPPEKPNVRIVFKKGRRYFVRRQCATEALAQGKAVKSERKANVSR